MLRTISVYISPPLVLCNQECVCTTTQYLKKEIFWGATLSLSVRQTPLSMRSAAMWPTSLLSVSFLTATLPDYCSLTYACDTPRWIYTHRPYHTAPNKFLLEEHAGNGLELHYCSNKGSSDQLVAKVNISMSIIFLPNILHFYF
jgi:hypothetical protein